MTHFASPWLPLDTQGFFGELTRYNCSFAGGEQTNSNYLTKELSLITKSSLVLPYNYFY